MKRFYGAATASMFGVALLGMVLMMSNVQAAELKVLIGGSMTEVFKELAPAFEKASGHKLVVVPGTTPNLIKAATSGEAFDAGVVPVDVMKDAAARAKFAAGPTTDIARVGFGVIVRAGHPKPDLGTPEAFKQAMLKTQSVAFIPESAAGAQVLRVFERLGIGDAMKSKTKVQTATGNIALAVAKGDADLGVFLANTLIAPGVEPPVMFPPELQQDLVFTGAISAGTKEADAAKALLSYLKSPAAAAIIKAKGMTPG
jgi:molybdate transport system substrate-binding protein